MLLVFVVQAFFLDLVTLVHSFHGSQDAAAFGQAVKFSQHRFFNKFR